MGIAIAACWRLWAVMSCVRPVPTFGCASNVPDPGPSFTLGTHFAIKERNGMTMGTWSLKSLRRFLQRQSRWSMVMSYQQCKKKRARAKSLMTKLWVRTLRIMENLIVRTTSMLRSPSNVHIEGVWSRICGRQIASELSHLR